MAVDVDDARARRLAEEEREKPRPIAIQLIGTPPRSEPRPRSKSARDAGRRPGEALELARSQRRQPSAVDAAPAWSTLHGQESFTATCLMRVYSSIE